MNFGMSRKEALDRAKQNKSVVKRNKNSVMSIMRGVHDDVVIEDPNEQTHSEYPTKRTIQIVPNDKNSANSINEKLRQSMQHLILV